MIIISSFLREVIVPSMRADIAADVAAMSSRSQAARTVRRLVFQRVPTMRVQLAGSPKALGPMHTDASYGHQVNEINVWLPLTQTHLNETNTLWSESAPGRGDFAPFKVGYGEAVRFWGEC